MVSYMYVSSGWFYLSSEHYTLDKATRKVYGTYRPVCIAANRLPVVAGSRTSWLFMGDGARMLGLAVHDVELSVEEISASIRAGRPVICSMGPGDFTETGHFIVLYDVDDSGSVAVRDPVSISRTGKRWDLASLVPQIRILWGYFAE